METLRLWLINHAPWLRIQSIRVEMTDIFEIIILSFLVYYVLVWIKKSRAWTLLKGMLLIVFFVALMYLLRMDTLTFIIGKGINIILISAIIIFQPELRRVLEQIGETEFFANLLPTGSGKEEQQRFSDRTVNEIVRATVEMAKVKTGALIVLERNETLERYERTGIALNAVVSSQLLINIFEHNTPLHDGAVLIRGDRIVSATCYLPLSDNQTLEKDLGTRHRAAVGVSEATDSLTIVVSEETGKISLASKGELERNLTEENLRARLIAFQNKTVIAPARKRLFGSRDKARREASQNRADAAQHTQAGKDGAVRARAGQEQAKGSSAEAKDGAVRVKASQTGEKGSSAGERDVSVGEKAGSAGDAGERGKGSAT